MKAKRAGRFAISAIRTLDYQSVGDEGDAQVEQVAVEAPTSQPAEPVAAEEMAKPKRSRSKQAQATAA